jgi:sterol 3beta-glucosyltransferase
MKIAIVTRDTRGGVQPYVALGVGLRDAGHDVRMVATEDFVPMFDEAGLVSAPLPGDSRADMTSVQSMTDTSPMANMRMAGRMMTEHLPQWTRDTLAACEGADVLTGGIGGMMTGLSVAEKLGVPFVPTHLQPVDAPTSAYPGPLLSGVPAWTGDLGRVLSHRLSNFAIWMPFGRAMALARREALGLSGRPTAADGQPVLYGFSQHVVPMPPSAHPRGRVTGYWFSDAPAGSTLPDDLERFVSQPGPVVSIGFGSMATSDPAALADIVREAVHAADVRAVLLTGWGGLVDAPADDRVIVAESVPHDLLFPRVAATVHHGGAGTTGAAVRAGKPTIVIPFTVDQPFWGSRMYALGVGPRPIPRRRITADGLAAALREAVSDAQMRARAEDLGALIRAEDGVGRAVEEFDRIASRA